ncbi:uncharacterized protein LOC126778526 isoform X2 [Nymphalis io]|uniref:uncharacterized protein LOC126778526 isoform X2 n=1 Tax=Inachis io TaxID=171585 RepID=UPI0021677976|nr:uncharacterized protein LOC126778526 isoform X2 [Nymphalis io]
MEFTPSLSAFQGVIISADSVHSFSKLTSRGGNEDKIQYVIDSIRNFLQKEKYMVDNKILEESVQIMRKFTFYVVINADLTILEEMVGLDGIDFFIWTIPTVPKCLMCEILWRLHMDTFIYEILVFSCPQLALQVADALIENFKYFNPTDCLHKLKLLSAASYRLLCRFVFFNLENDELIHALNNVKKCLNYFVDPPNKSKLEGLSKDEMYKLIGNRLYLMLCLLIDCFNNFVTVQKLKPSDFQEIYELTYKESVINKNQTSIAISDCSNNSLLECINNSNLVLLDVCENLVMGVSVEIFCSWSEFEENGKSMQQTIGELCYKVHQTLCKIASISDHPVVTMLQQISCKPLDLIEVVKKSNTEDIVENINKRDNESALWVKALLHIDKLVENKILIEQIANNLDVLNEDECLKLFKILHSHLKANTEDTEFEILLAVIVFQRCSSSPKHEIVEEHFNNYLFNNNFQTPAFNNMMIEFFNKLIISPDMDASDVLSVFIQNPRKVFARIFTIASENTQQTDIMLKVMISLEKYSKHYYNEETEPCIILVAKDIIANNLNTDEKTNNFIKFLSCIKTSNAIPGPKLFLLIIMPNLHSALLSKNIGSVYINCKLLQAAYPLNELIEYRAPTLAMLAQVLDMLRWKINTFSLLAPSTLDLVLKLQTSLLNTYEALIPEKESKWLKSKLRNINPLNMYYFRCLWNPPGNTFVEVISGIRIHKDMDIEHLTVWLSQVICSTITQEWYQIWDSLSVFGNGKILDIFHDALLLLSVAEKSNHTETTNGCLFYCYTNFVNIIRYKFIKTPISDNQITTIFNKFALIENLIEERDLEVFSVIFLPLLSFIAAIQNVPVDISQMLLNKLKHEVFVDMINHLFIKEKIRN